MVNPTDHSRSKEEVIPQIPRMLKLRSNEAVDPRVTWTHLDREIEGLGRLPVLGDVV
jgi:hypothetical protein